MYLIIAGNGYGQRCIMGQTNSHAAAQAYADAANRRNAWLRCRIGIHNRRTKGGRINLPADLWRGFHVVAAVAL